MTTAIWWIRRDLRLEDNLALNSAAQSADQVIPVFILDPTLTDSSWTGPKRVAFLYAGLRELDQELRSVGSQLVVRSGNPTEVLSTLCAETGADLITAEADFSPYAHQRDKKVSEILPLKLTPGLTVLSPDEIRKSDGGIYTVFTPYSKAWKNSFSPVKSVPKPTKLISPPGIKSESIPTNPSILINTQFRPGSAEANRRLDHFTDRVIAGYSESRNRMDLDGTSGLSPYLRFGMVSARQAANAAINSINRASNDISRKGAETWLNELIWREFYIYILFHFPFVKHMSFKKEMRQIPWINDLTDFSAWAEGRTGYPIIDAAMRQLVQTGWMHNRARMVTASFLTKDLLIDWRWGEKYFMQHLIDGDPAANNGGWQWTAGTGTDAAPYFRVFNPILQSIKFDPHGHYIKKFVPELANVPEKYIHAPWEMDSLNQKKTGCTIGKDYPFPIVDHAWARARMLHAYKVF